LTNDTSHTLALRLHELVDSFLAYRVMAADGTPAALEIIQHNGKAMHRLADDMMVALNESGRKGLAARLDSDPVEVLEAIGAAIRDRATAAVRMH
jgi:hypothetical protein